MRIKSKLACTSEKKIIVKVCVFQEGIRNNNHFNGLEWIESDVLFQTYKVIIIGQQNFPIFA